MTSKGNTEPTFRAGAFKRRLARVFGLQLTAVVIVCAMGFYDVAPPVAVFAVVVIVLLLGWMATQREWAPVSALAAVMSNWDESQASPDVLRPENLKRGTDADIASLTRGLHGFATRIADFNQRERNFTRDASHELTKPTCDHHVSANGRFGASSGVIVIVALRCRRALTSHFSRADVSCTEPSRTAC
ncbi:MAG: hypothetical protein WDW38_006927 [Sanguina aurantia]